MRQILLGMTDMLTQTQGMRHGVVAEGVYVAEVGVESVESSCRAPTRLTRARGATTC